MGPVPILKPEIDVEKEDKKCSYSLSVSVSVMDKWRDGVE